jgi:hypothetical protein
MERTPNLLRLKPGITFTVMALFLASLVTLLIFPSALLAADVNGDFSLDMKVNGLDMLTSQSFSVTPDETLVFDLYIHDVLKPVEMKRLSVEIFFAGIPVSTITQDLSEVINPGETYQPLIPPVNARDYLSIWGVNVTTGKYKAIIKLEYTALGQLKNWTQSREVEVPGNPLTTIAGVAAAIITGIALGGVAALLKSLAGYSLETQALSGKKSLEAQTRSKVSGSLVAAVKKILVKDRCPICREVIKHGHCPSCRKSARELLRIYRRRIHDLAAAGIKLLADGEVKSIQELPQRLGINGRLASDVTATIQNTRLFEAKRVSRSLLTSALLTGISSAIAGILWVTIGGFAALNTTVLMVILVLSVLIPFVIARVLRMRMLRWLNRPPSPPPCQTPVSDQD